MAVVCLLTALQDLFGLTLHWRPPHPVSMGTCEAAQRRSQRLTELMGLKEQQVIHQRSVRRAPSCPAYDSVLGHGQLLNMSVKVSLRRRRCDQSTCGSDRQSE
mmetsp:Transcript_64465/g.178740  ORF Transcript_64465/g.178740 Transcript_64465/m.178740 type:complete len:103 (-) Transcript_64465:188-496(-)